MPQKQETYSDPIEEILSWTNDSVLAVITKIEGPSYRPLGAMMAISMDGKRIGTLSSGCIEQDITLHAIEALSSCRPKFLRYGQGSPFVDIKLPCGGGLEVFLIPRPDREVLQRIAEQRRARSICALRLDCKSGSISFGDRDETGQDGTSFSIQILPELQFIIFGKGPEATTFAALAQSAGYPNIILSPDRETLDLGVAGGSKTQHLLTPHFPQNLHVDPYTAIVLFFHDHDWEPPILAGAATTSAFYIGAQGSRLARKTRDLTLEAMGVDNKAIQSLRGPIGLIPSVRDARTLAVSVLAEILATSTKGS